MKITGTFKGEFELEVEHEYQGDDIIHDVEEMLNENGFKFTKLDVEVEKDKYTWEEINWIKADEIYEERKMNYEDSSGGC